VEYLLAMVAAVLLGTGFVLQQRVAERAPKAHFLHVRLFGDLVRKPRWLVGVAAMVGGQLASAWVLGHLKLSIAEPLLASNLIFALILAAILSRQRVTKTELIGAVILSAGVAALALTRAPRSATVSFGPFTYWPAAAGIGLMAYALIQTGRRRRVEQRAMLTGIAAGLVFGISDALTRRTMQLLGAHGLAALFTSWPAYCLVAAGFVGILLLESSFNAGPLRTSLPGIAAAEPISGIVLGMVVFADPVFVSPGMLALRAAGIAALIIGVTMVARAPVLCSLRRLPVDHGLAVARRADGTIIAISRPSYRSRLPERSVLCQSVRPPRAPSRRPYGELRALACRAPTRRAPSERWVYTADGFEASPLMNMASAPRCRAIKGRKAD
jgi:drug/metabolite transporter (DMT)-like permease